MLIWIGLYLLLIWLPIQGDIKLDRVKMRVNTFYRGYQSSCVVIAAPKGRSGAVIA
jgi:hypothetical protein